MPTEIMPEPGRTYPAWDAVSPKEERLNEVLLARTEGKVQALMQYLLTHREIHQYHSYANVVSVRRLGYNDHGAVHARITTYNALKILRLLHEAGVASSLEREEVGTYEDAQFAVALGCFLHDLGMGVTRQDHEWHSITFADTYIREAIAQAYAPDDSLRVVLRALAHEVIVGHMAHARIHSIEAGIVLVADGTDMSAGRSRVPQGFDRDPAVGDIHRFSASAITRVDITKGESKPVRVMVQMENVTGIFQVEEVLMTKVKASPMMPYLEIGVSVGDAPPRFYL